jgi:hypothetical protein
MLDFSPITEQKQPLGEFAATVSKDDLYTTTNGIIDQMLAMIEDIEDSDVVFVPNDPGANDPGASEDEREMAWTFGHIVVHSTAGIEEAAMLGLSLARGVEPKERSRYETHWTTIATVEQIRQRLQESRRMALSMLDAWPEAPHYAVTQTPIPRFGPMNAIARYLLGLMHANSHLGQLAETISQAKSARVLA